MPNTRRMVARARVCVLSHTGLLRCTVPARAKLRIELADGVTLDEVKSKTEADFRVALKNT